VSIKQIHVCDGCGKELKETKNIYHLVLKTDRYYDSVEMTHNLEQLEFCPVCAREIKQVLKRIAEKLDGGSEGGSTAPSKEFDSGYEHWKLHGK
jgi:hypothetical protein